jgi:LacI family transcriptional regulator
MEHSAYANGYNVFLCNTDEDPERELVVLGSLEEKRVDGLVLCSSRLEDAKLTEVLARFPAVVLVNRTLPEQVGWTVMVDDERGAMVTAEHLLKSGHRNIGFLAGPQASVSSVKRLQGYQKALQDNGLDVVSDWVRYCHPSAESAQGTAQELLTDHPELTALFCYNDLVAVGVLKAAASMEKNVPEELAVVGFDDIFLADLISPALTTCRVPRYEMGQAAMELLLAQIENCQDDCRDIIIEPELIVRQSAP